MALYDDKCDIIRNNIATIREKIWNIEIIRKNVHTNISQTKSKIQTVVSRQLESLRNREIWLCEKVQLLQSTKQELLDQQSDELSQVLGSLESCLNFMASMESHGASQVQRDYMGGLIEDCINRFENLELDATDISYMTFQADVSALKACIQNFGSVDLTCSPDVYQLCSGHDTPSLQPPVDFSHNSPLTHMSFTFPHEDMPVSEWLRSATDDCSQEHQLTHMEPAFLADMSGWLTETHRNSTSTQSWLTGGWQQTEDDQSQFSSYEMINRDNRSERSDSQSDIEVISHSEWSAWECDILERRFVEIMQSPTSQWLTNQDFCEVTAPFAEMKYFTEISSCLNDWLQGFTTSPMEEKDEDKDSCCHGSKCAEPAAQFDIENLYELTCVKETPTNNWLLPQQPTVADVGAVCRANELCQTLQECVAPELCCSAEQNEPVQPSSITGVDKNGQLDWNAWMKLPSVEDTREPSVANTAASDAENTWLSGASTDFHVDIFAPFNVAASEEKWLAPFDLEDSFKVESSVTLDFPAQPSESSWLQHGSSDKPAEKYDDNLNVWLKSSEKINVLASKSMFDDVSLPLKYAADVDVLDNREVDSKASDLVWLLKDQCNVKEKMHAMRLCSPEPVYDTDRLQRWLVY